ncbi:MAG: sporulation transcriptional regulator SpoIIID [Clostridiales bacterium]|nr:sporulation transcriptional regulator SpoIIID [Clostridiales bacterium]
MKEYIAERVIEIADYLLEHGSTIREVAQVYCVSKSTAHKDLSERLPLLDKERYERVSAALDGNWAERYLRGGEATKRKYCVEKTPQ